MIQSTWPARRSPSTDDITSEFPALAARQLGWYDVPLLCGYEISIARSLPRCIRVLLHWNTTRSQSQIHHVYLHEARRLRPDLCDVPAVDFEELERWIESNLCEEDPPSITRRPPGHGDSDSDSDGDGDGDGHGDSDGDEAGGIDDGSRS